MSLVAFLQYLWISVLVCLIVFASVLFLADRLFNKNGIFFAEIEAYENCSKSFCYIF